MEMLAKDRSRRISFTIGSKRAIAVGHPIRGLGRTALGLAAALVSSLFYPMGCNCDETLEQVTCDYNVEPSGSNSPIEFGEVEVGAERARTVRITNNGNVRLDEFEFVFAERNGLHYRMGLPETFQVDVGDTVNISAIFSPLAESTNLGSSVSISHPTKEGASCPAYLVNLDGSSYERLVPPDAGVEDDAGIVDDAGIDAGPIDAGPDGGSIIDAGIVTPPDAGLIVGPNAVFEARGALQEARTGFASLVLDDGSILVVGGYGANGQALDSIERLDPDKGMSTIVARMAVPRGEPGAALLPSGVVAIAGGISSATGGLGVTTIEIYDPDAEDPDLVLWCAPNQGECGLDDIDQGQGLLNEGRLDPVVVASVADPDVASLADLLVVAYGSIVNDMEERLPATGGYLVDLTSAPVVNPLSGADLVMARQGEARVFGENGRFALINGAATLGAPVSDLVIYDPVAQAVTSVDISLDPRIGGSGALLSDGNVVLAGGRDTMGVVSVSLQKVLDIFGTPSVEDVPDLTVDKRFGASLLALDDDVLLFAGGLSKDSANLEVEDSFVPLKTAEILVPFGTGYLRLSPENNLATPRFGHRSHVLGSQQNKGIFIGGIAVTPRRTPLPSVERYHLLENKFETYGLMGAGASFSAMGLTPSGGLLSVGGLDPHTGALSANARVFDAEEDTFSNYPGLIEPRRDHTVTMLEDNVSYLVVGGKDASGQVLRSASIYVPLNPAGFDEPLPVELNRARANHTATPLEDGSVLLCGGQGSGGEALDTCEIFVPPGNPQDPDTYEDAEFRLALGRLSTGRLGHTATPLDNGEVLLVGGGDIEQDLVGADYYSPTEERIFETGLPGYARRNHVAVAFGSGRVLVAGGDVNVGGESATATAEVYEHINGIFIPLEDMDFPRSGAAGFLLAGGEVLIVGGAKEESLDFPTRALDSAELYVPGLSGVGTFEDIDISLSFGRGDIRTVDVFGRGMVAGGTSRDGRIANGDERRTPLFFVDRLLNPESE
jgi:hypothetical protein